MNAGGDVPSYWPEFHDHERKDAKDIKEDDDEKIQDWLSLHRVPCILSRMVVSALPGTEYQMPCRKFMDFFLGAFATWRAILLSK
jgi:hypothetical protein